MAKHSPVASSSTSPSSSSGQAPPSPQLYHRKQRTQFPSSSFPGPSSALLSLLATLATSSVAEGSPAPPSFLCPSYNSETNHIVLPTSVIKTPHVSPPSPVRSSLNPSNARAVVGKSIPDRFSQGDDGMWRPATEFTYYGSTVCPSCRQPTNAVSSVDDQVKAQADSSPSPSSTPSNNFIDTLPPGWNEDLISSAGRTTLIISLSLGLATFICLFIIGCLFWRKNKHRKYKDIDVEMKGRRKKRKIGMGDDDREMMLEKEVRAKQKLWARATARWKANARYSARQRRGKRPVPSRTAEVALESESNDDQGDMVPVSSAPSVVSHRSSVTTRPEDIPSGGTIQPDSNEVEESRSDRSISPPPNNSLLSPPAYRQRSHLPSIVIQNDTINSSDYTHSNVTRLSPSYTPSRRPSHSTILSTINHSDQPFDSDPYISPFHVAHVATDDKATLARLASLASAPPTEANEGEPSHSQVSAPVWQDEDLDEFEETSGTTSCLQPFSSVLPLPPTKEKMAAPNFYDYPFAFEDLASTDTEVGPSAPPFEVSPSAPTLGAIDATPSAPPLMDEFSTESYTDAEWTQPGNDMDQNQKIDDDRLPRLPENHESCGSTDIPPVQGPVASDGTLPSYYP